MGCSLPGSSVHGIFQASVLEWSAIAFSKAMSYVCLSFPQCLADPSPLIITLIAHLACKALLCWWFHLVFSPVLRGREGGMGKVTHLISHLRMLRPRASCVTCPAYEAGCQRLILQMERGSLTLNTVCFPLIFYYFIWMVLISLEIVDLTCMVLGIPTAFKRQGKLLRLGGFGDLIYLGFLMITPCCSSVQMR